MTDYLNIREAGEGRCRRRLCREPAVDLVVEAALGSAQSVRPELGPPPPPCTACRNLDNNQLTGSIPTALGSLTSLLEL